ncbi:hypothetical protein [Terasakiella brassicae]|nr:hypothetical protein [Terasakiella brassicae]
MNRTLTIARKNRYTHPGHETRTNELAKLLVNAFGYDQAIEKAKQSHWDNVAQAIHFMLSKSYNRF